jgi:hypothetical protein
MEKGGTMFSHRYITRISRSLVMTFLLGLAACGGGGGGGGDGGGGGGGNTAPVANAGADQETKLNTLVTLNGGASSNALTYSWTLTNRPAGSAVTLANATTVNPTFTPDVGGVYTASLVVNNGTANSAADSVAVTAGVLIPEYDALRYCPNNYSATYQWTVGPNTGLQVTSTRNGPETVNYLAGALTGTIINGGRDGINYITSNNGTSYKLLGASLGGGVSTYLSTDCALSAHPPGWSFGIVYDRRVIDQGSYFAVVTNPRACVFDNTQQILFTIQNVTVQGTPYPNAVIWWTLDKIRPYQALNAPALAALGVAFPTTGDTGGFAVTDVDIRGFQSGPIAGGDINADTGVLNDLAVRTALTCN